MKTRRILAASTAALLAFGTTAIVASATAEKFTVALEVKAAAKDGVADEAAALKAVDVTITTDDAEDTTATLPEVGKDITLKATEVKDKDGNVTGWDVTYEVDKSYTALTDDTAAGLKVTVTKAADKKDDNTSDDNTSSGNTSKPSEAPTYDADDIEDDGTVIGAGVTASISESAAAKLPEDFKIKATAVIVDKGEKDKDGNWLVSDGSDVVKKLSKSLKKEIAKIKYSDFEIVDIEVADGKYAESSTPVAITFTVEVGFDANVYHVSGDSVELLKSKSRKLSNGNYEVTFSTKTFSPFIFTSAELKNAKATNADNEPTSAAATSDGATTNPDTGIALAIAPVVLAAGAVAVVALKKKH